MLVSADSFDISKVKVVIWDLDNTFWAGTITEEEVQPIQENIDLIKELSMHGIVNSICSKNYFEECKSKLMDWGVWDYFVFPSIDWAPKTNRVIQILNDMGLRPVNALFLDDEPANLQRVLGVDDSIMCGTAQDLAESLANQITSLKLDSSCSRLRQYHELEKKAEARTHFDSDEEFLSNAGIKVYLGKNTKAQKERIYELINRTNQLNYTKKRLEKNEVDELLNDLEYECAYISCKDNYCDYGIVGFYALNKKENRLDHYLFSCRTIGMGIEQYIYSYLGFPALFVNGDVVTTLNTIDTPKWVELVNGWADTNDTRASSDKILVKGPCDVAQIVPFFADGELFETEFAYISEKKKGMYIEAFNHSSQVLAALKLSDKTKTELANSVPFIDEEYYKTTIFKIKYDYIIFSLLSDYSLGLYRNKKNPDIIIPFAQYTRDCTQEDQWKYALSVLMQGGKADDSIVEQFRAFQDSYEPIGHISDEQLLSNLQEIRDNIDSNTTIIFLNGAEIPFKRECKPGYENREVLHAHLNRLLEEFVSRNQNCHIINVNDYFEDDDPYLDTIDHYKKVIYYRIALGIQQFIEGKSDDKNLAVQDSLLKTKKHAALHRMAARIYHKLKG